ncbi:hypothetical protein A8C56_23610 [Niabella ginsenosidivorans]|uniref:beta-N-acetylhexosaminidase n=2 Tax=Niabella ginsenosidivorans TaxID=1176587 RepID=A0A1A9IA60_9BACT|nr:hypothetical protein A8C56_23610 [Niabella ginsenosidivorans]
MLFALLCFHSALPAQNGIKLIPLPAILTARAGSFIIGNSTALVYNSRNAQLKAIARLFQDHIKELSGIELNASSGRGSGSRIVFHIVPGAGLGNEGYTLNVARGQIDITAATASGIFYGVQTLLQTLPAIRTNEPLQVPCMWVKDRPRFAWRGLMLDVSRHFFSPEMVKQLIDIMASFKMNVLHWHLTDDQGWRIEIKKYPRLTSVGAWRMEKDEALFYQKDTAALKGKPSCRYGGYYTREQVKDIIAYAALRNISIVPEIEMPGHSGAALAAYPEYSCSGTPQPVPNTQLSGNFDWFHSNYCPGNPATYTFLQNILTEVTDLFPSKYIHIGGDEVNKKDWKTCPRCQALMQKEQLKTEEALQSYFIRRMEQFIRSRGKRLIGWEEILEGDSLAPDAAVMSWIGEKRGIEAARKHHAVIMCPGNPLYLNRHQTANSRYEAHAPSFSINTLEKVYAYDPLPAVLSTGEQQYVLGTQAVLWTEFIKSVDQVQYMLFPRLCALAEIAWTPRAKQDFWSFKKRLKPRLTAFEQTGIRFFNKERF